MAVADFDAEELLADLPSDAFSSPERDDHGSRNDSLFISSQPSPTQQTNSQQQRPQAVMRQTTLFGGRVPGSTMPANKPPARPVMNSQEPPTHHKLDQDALKTWIYPTNLGTIRDYQFNIVARGLFHNLLVALPTGLGKTFIAATVMLNWFRWTKDAQIIFVAPTKPLVAQQVKACFNIVGIPRHETTMLTGETPPDLRADEWETKRVFFTTPQTIMNDLSKGICDPKRIVLIVVDEAHRATGGYAYVQLVNFVRRFNPSFRVLGLTATPGDSVEKVQQVIDGLGISRVEIRTELSIDIRQFVHHRDVETVLFDPSEEMVMVLDLFAKALQPLLDKLCGQNAFYQRDAKMLTSFGLHQASVKWRASDAGRKASFPLKAMIHSIFTLLASLAHPITLLRFHGIGPFYHNLLGFQNEKSGGKYNKQIKESPHFQQMMTRIKPWIANPRFIGHPKLEYLEGVLLDHFSNAGSGPTGQNTRVMVFVHYRDSAEEATRVLQRHAPLIKPHVFVGQADSKSSEGMNQKTQLEIIEKFQKGEFNTIVATCIGEEGLDIGEVDLIVCYDASASPIRMLQRMGRTGRKRAGKIVLLMMRGKEENDFVKAKDNYEQMQKMISSGERFNFHYDLSPRIVPRAIQPAVEKRTIEIPIQNSQSDLPEPKRRKGKKRAKKAPKKFHMPDGVRTGFVKASRLGQGRDSDDAGSDQGSEGETPPNLDREEAAIPDLAEVSLTSLQQRELEMNYQQIGGEDSTQVVELPHLDAFPSQQRNLAPTSTLRHGRATRRMVSLLQKMHSIDGERLDVLEKNFDPEYLRSNSPSQKASAQASKATKKKTHHPVYARNEKRQTGLKGRDVMSEEDLDDSDEDDLDGFIVDDASVTEREPSSEAASPAPLDGEGRPFYTSQKDYQGESEEDELPEFGEMVKKPGKVAPADSTKGRDVGRKAKRRRVIEDSSD